METSRWIKPESAKQWIAIDRAGRPHGRFVSTAALSETLVLDLIRSLLPEIAGVRLVSWNQATTSQRMEAAGFKPFTPLMCAKLGLHPIPEPPSPPKQPITHIEGLPPYQRVPSRVGRWANKLQKHFGNAGGDH